jgi:hypothetical protein
MLFKKITAVYLDNRTQHMNILFGHNMEFINGVNK